MMTMGDEYGHTKRGNNNTYCHDNELNYVNWERTHFDEQGLRRFWSHLIKLRRARPELAQPHYLSDEACACSVAVSCAVQADCVRNR